MESRTTSALRLLGLARRAGRSGGPDVYLRAEGHPELAAVTSWFLILGYTLALAVYAIGLVGCGGRMGGGWGAFAGTGQVAKALLMTLLGLIMATVGEDFDEYRTWLEEAGVEVAAFNTTQGLQNRFQLNFRNHRKIVVVDGRSTWIGGLNVGDQGGRIIVSRFRQFATRLPQLAALFHAL